jgi:2-polyprenyl-6-hydroxyphenyl methylase / 3-demethylubiquinone-9 3-methyltransferase
VKSKQVLDVGCGGGLLAEAMARQGAAHVLGIDLAIKPLRVAQLHALEAGVDNVEYREVSAEGLATEAPAQFDVVTCMEMLEHVPDPSAVVKACHALVKPGGWVFFSTINRNPKSYLFAVVGAEYILNLLPKGTHDYAKFIKPSELAQWGRDAGLHLHEFKGMEYNPLTQRYWLSSNTSVNYVLACRKPAL